MDNKLRYANIIRILVKHYNIGENELIDTLKIKENKYILLLLMKNNNCLFMDDIKKLLEVKTNKSVLNNLNKAEEKLLINKEFRENYFEIEEFIEEQYKMYIKTGY